MKTFLIILLLSAITFVSCNRETKNYAHKVRFLVTYSNGDKDTIDYYIVTRENELGYCISEGNLIVGDGWSSRTLCSFVREYYVSYDSVTVIK